MTQFGDDLIQSLQEVAAYTKGEDVPGMVIHHAVSPSEVRKKAKLTQAEMAPLMGMSLSGYQKWEQGRRTVSGPAQTLLRVLEKNPKAVIDALAS
ncbi:helix-turn-helix domain-containing protein [Cohaesibacter gelatinilyticus]|uniref:Transcriptional regulator, XRE family n=1 Tax=Cohaesibacter gelatinilyticus TaxID=372072 RepID=A0A285PGV9_9HYPH|nr:helix-turn-helix domain-containing protein [Cohaesibacter gelatinilyticus]SNZ20955.1 transcriptional regulator, XRE family [Cohaesibacter gelatinilyticus]